MASYDWPQTWKWTGATPFTWGANLVVQPGEIVSLSREYELALTVSGWVRVRDVPTVAAPEPEAADEEDDEDDSEDTDEEEEIDTWSD